MVVRRTLLLLVQLFFVYCHNYMSGLECARRPVRLQVGITVGA